MPEVPGSPYEPYFTAQPTERPIPLGGVDAPGAAFGENIANAVRTFGGDVEKASDEVFNRALALRKLQIDGNIRDLTTNYYNELAPIQSDFLTAQGNNASQDSLNSHLAKMEQVRQNYVEQAKQYGIYGVNRFGEEAASLQRSFIREAAVYSGVQTRKSLVAGNNASVDMLTRSMTGLESEKEFNDVATKGEGIIRQNGIADEGKDPRKIEDEVLRFKQGLRKQQVRSLYVDNPNAAMGLLETHKKELGDDYADLHKEVENRWETVEGGRLAARAAEEARQTGDIEGAVAAVKDAVRADPIAGKIAGMDNKVAEMTRHLNRGNNYDAQGTVDSGKQYIANKISTANGTIKTLADLEASDPQVKVIEAQLRNANRNGALWVAGLNTWIGHNWEKAHTDQQDENFKQLWGSSFSRDPQARQQFMQDSLDLNKFDLRLPQWQQLMRRREEILNHPDTENPMFNNAMRVAHRGDLATSLQQLGIFKRTDANATKYDRWTGSLMTSLDEWMRFHDGKKPSDTELADEIIRPTVREQVRDGFFAQHFGRRRGFFEMDIPKDEMVKWKQLESDRMRKMGQDVSPDQVTDAQAQTAAWRSLYDELYGKGADSGGSSTVPRSK